VAHRGPGSYEIQYRSGWTDGLKRRCSSRFGARGAAYHDILGIANADITVCSLVTGSQMGLPMPARWPQPMRSAPGRFGCDPATAAGGVEEVRAGHQPQGRQFVRADDPAIAGAAGGW